MYTEYFGLSHRAFSKTPDPRFLYLNEEYEEALHSLLYAVEEREMGILVGSVGSGKTLLTRALLDRLDERHRVAVILNPRLSPVQFLRTVAEELGVEHPKRYKSDLVFQIQDRLMAIEEEGGTAVLIIDEAQLIPRKAVFDEIRMLTNFQLDDRNLLAILLVGQLELKKRLRHPVYQPFTQRLGAEFELSSLDSEQTRSYIAHRVKVAGGDVDGLFAPGSFDLIFEASDGIPRVINHIATQCLLDCLGRNGKRVSGESVRRVTDGMMFLPSRMRKG